MVTCDPSDRLGAALDRIAALESQTPQARQLQYEADVAMAGDGSSERHGPGHACPLCPPEDEE
jgi:hypothetical protein